MEKLLAMHVAAQLTQAACSNAGGSAVVISADLSDPQVRAKNLQVWETFRVFYRGVTGALEDQKSWPNPKVDAGQLFPSLLQSAAPLLQSLLGIPDVGNLIKKLIAAIPAPSQPPAGPLPDPGAKP